MTTYTAYLTADELRELLVTVDESQTARMEQGQDPEPTLASARVELARALKKSVAVSPATPPVPETIEFVGAVIKPRN